MKKKKSMVRRVNAHWYTVKPRGKKVQDEKTKTNHQYDQVTATELKAIRQEIQARLRKACGVSSDEYWEYLVKNWKINRVLVIEEGRHKDWTGFAMIKEGWQCFPDKRSKGYSRCTFQNPSWYIEMICSDRSDGIQGRGTKLMELIQEEAMCQNIKFITLNSLAYVIPFYYKLGFRLTLGKECVDHPALKGMLAKIAKEKKKFAEEEMAYEDETFAAFLLKTFEVGLAGRKQKYKGKVADCPDGDLRTCADTGIYMTLCLDGSKTIMLHPRK